MIRRKRERAPKLQIHHRPITGRVNNVTMTRGEFESAAEPQAGLDLIIGGEVSWFCRIGKCVTVLIQENYPNSKSGTAIHITYLMSLSLTPHFDAE